MIQTALTATPEDAAQLQLMLDALAHRPRTPTPRWHPALLSSMQLGYLHSKARITVCAAGRRSFKTEAAKRRLVKSAVGFTAYSDGRFFACGPTQQQAKDIFWSDLKALTPRWALAGAADQAVSESTLTINLINGAIIRVAGLDKPSRIEGRDWDGGVVTEFGSCKAGILSEHIRPMMMRGGWADIEGVPEGRNHYFELVQAVTEGTWPQSIFCHWTTEDVLHLWQGVEKAKIELEHAMATMDTLTYQQEYQAAFISFEGMAYYSFGRDTNLPPAGQRVDYDPELALVLCFDFNRSPGTCVIVQEHPADRYPWLTKPRKTITACCDEVFIRRNSTTPKVVTEVLEKYGDHKKEVHYYGDPSGGQKRSSNTEGSDWDMIDDMLGRVFDRRAVSFVERAAPTERSRLNAMNSRLYSTDGHIGMVVDPVRCIELIHDFEGVQVDDSGAMAKEQGSPRTHLSDGLGYYIRCEHPVVMPVTTSSSI